MDKRGGEGVILFQENNIVVRKLTCHDEALLVKWLSNPQLLQYYEGRDRVHNLEMIREHFYPERDAEVRCIVEYEGQPIGYIQYYYVDEITKKEYDYKTFNGKIIGIDQFIGETHLWNQGIGRKLVSAMVKYLFEYEHANKVIMDPQAWNERALACYEKCGFKKVKWLPKHEWHEGELRDCWLIECHLKEEI